MCTILATVVGRVPDAVLRAKLAPSFAILSAMAERHPDQVGPQSHCMHAAQSTCAFHHCMMAHPH